MPETIAVSGLDGQVDEESILAAARRRDAAAIAQLYQRYVRPIYRYLYSRVGNSADAEDLTSQTFLSALEGLPRYRHKGRFAAWLFTIAHRRAMDHFRRHRPQVDFDDRSIPADGPDPDGQVIQTEAREDLSRRIGALSEWDQELLRLRYVADLSFAEIGAVLGKSEEAAKKSLYRLLATLQEKMEADGG
ncbi:MAG TPA: sigma-70 family RNA polymerase sigma factor [Anaerolineales bacterium]|nr:sigma-70 family RNA polymerase sigma factor [Anaerolineales bacterium]